VETSDQETGNEQQPQNTIHARTSEGRMFTTNARCRLIGMPTRQSDGSDRDRKREATKHRRILNQPN
jgi:IS5 family transposase